MYADLFEHDVGADIAVELLDLAVLHVPEVGARNVELGSVSPDDACGRLERPGEGAPDRELDRYDAPHNVDTMEFPVNVGSQLAHEDHRVAQMHAAEALLADGIEHAVVGEQVDEPLHVHDIAL